MSATRPLRSVLKAATLSLCALGTLYVGAITYLWLNRPAISFDVVQRLNSLLPQVAEDQRGWPLFKKGMIALGAQDEFAFPGDAKWVIDGEFLRQRTAGFDLLAQCAARPALGYVPSIHPQAADADLLPYDPAQARPAAPSSPVFALLLPQLGLQRKAAKMCAADALHALDEGDSARFVRDISTMLGLANQAEESGFLISQLVGSALRAMAFERIIMGLEWRPDVVSDEDLAKLTEILRSISPSAYTIDLDAELLGITDCIQRTYTDNGSGDGWFNSVYATRLLTELTAMSSSDAQKDDSNDSWSATATVLLSPISAALVATRKETIDLCESMMRQCEEQSRLPIWQQDASYESTFESLVSRTEFAKIKWTLLRLLFPALSRASHVRRMGESQSLAAQVAIACIQYRRSHAGVWPTNFGALAPKFLDTPPLDPMTGEAVTLENVGASLVISSTAPSHRVWPDRDVQPPWVWFSGDDQLKRWRAGEKPEVTSP